MTNVPPTMDLLATVVNAYEDGLGSTAVSVTPTLDLLENVISA